MKNSFFYKVKFVLGKALVRLYGMLIDAIDGKVVYGNPYQTPGLESLENNYELIREELERVLTEREIPGIEEFFIEQQNLAGNRSWKSFPLFIFGNEFVDNTQLCPQTAELLLNVQGFCSAMFSVLSAGQQIPAHKGIFKGVDGQKCYWEEGKVILFDDAHTHSATNHTKQDRVVLFIDIIRPLPFPLNRINKFLYRALSKLLFITEIAERHRKFGNYNVKKIAIDFY